MVDDTPLLKRRYNLDWLVGGGLALAALGLYISTLAPTVLAGDAGEFQFVAWLPGIAHPTGYPLYILLGWLWTHLFPFGEVAWRMNLLSTVFAAGTVGLTYAASRQLLDKTLPETPLPGRIIAAVVAAATFAVTHTFWSQAVVAEVYSLHAMFVAAILWLALKLWSADCNTCTVVGHRPDRRKGPHSGTGKLLALAFGLSLTHHRTIVLLLPALVLFLWRSGQSPTVGSKRPARGISPAVDGRLLVSYSLLLAAPLLLYLYLPLAAPATPYVTLTLSDTQTLTLYDHSPRGFWDHVMGTVFTGGLQPAAAGLDRFVLTWQLLQQQVGWIGVILALAGLATLWQRRQVDLLLLTGLGLFGFVAFNLIYFIGDIFVLFIPAWLFVSLWIGTGALGFSHWIADSFVRRKSSLHETPALGEISQRLSRDIYRLVVVIFVVGFGFLPVALLATRITRIDQKHSSGAAERWQEILAEPIPQGAILLSNDRNEIMPMWYYQYVEGRRLDLLGLFPLIVTEPAYANVGRLLDQALASKRPVYLIKSMEGLSLKVNLTPEGTLFRATPVDDALPTNQHNATLPEIVLEATPGQSVTETIKVLGHDATPAKISPGAQVAITLHWQVVQELSIDYTSYVHLVAGDGQGITQSDHQPGGNFYPSSYWQVGEIVRDQHTLTIPPDLPAGVYHLRAGMYYQPEPGLIKGMGEGEEIGLLELQF